MELWIRSQNRRNLMKAEDIVIVDNYIEVYKYNDEMTRVAEYKTTERALEVLNEIQSILKPQEYEVPTGRGTYTTSSNISNYVYEMPSE